MPEGHSILRHANRHRDLLAGQIIAATSPQGRFSRGAARLNGRRLLDVQAHGKHLFYKWERAETLHIHLGLYGKYRVFRGEPGRPTPNTRLTLSTDDATIHLAGPTVCELVEPSGEEAIRARLGPDPLQAGRRGHNAPAFIDRLSRRSIPVGAAIIDQAVIAGLGNIYRAETLFLTGIHPAIPANEISVGQSKEIWSTSVRLLRKGVKEGRITTVPRRGRRRNAVDRLYVYKRDRYPCRECGGPISSGEMANRSIWWCEACQPRRG